VGGCRTGWWGPGWRHQWLSCRIVCVTTFSSSFKLPSLGTTTIMRRGESIISKGGEFANHFERRESRVKFVCSADTCQCTSQRSPSGFDPPSPAKQFVLLPASYLLSPLLLISIRDGMEGKITILFQTPGTTILDPRKRFFFPCRGGICYRHDAAQKRILIPSH
jgi:hypothetical protein